MTWIQDHPLESILILLLIIRGIAAAIRSVANPREGTRLDGVLDVVEGIVAHLGTILGGVAKVRGIRLPDGALSPQTPLLPPPDQVLDCPPSEKPTPVGEPEPPEPTTKPVTLEPAVHPPRIV